MSGFDFSEIEAMRDHLTQVRDDFVPDEMERGTRWVGETFIKDIRPITPVDTGQMEASWTAHYSKVDYDYYAWIWNHAVAEDGTTYYMEFVNDGHRQEPGRFVPLPWLGKTLVKDWVEGQFFLEATEEKMDKKLPKLIRRMESNIAKEIMNGL